MEELSKHEPQEVNIIAGAEESKSTGSPRSSSPDMAGRQPQSLVLSASGLVGEPIGSLSGSRIRDSAPEQEPPHV